MIYVRKAGDLALRKSAGIEAINHLTHARALTANLEDIALRSDEEAAVLLMLGAAHTTTKGWAAPEAEEVYMAAKTLCDVHTDSVHTFPTYLALHRFHAIRGELQEADKVGSRLLEEAEKSGDVDLLMPANVAHGYNSFFMGHVARADMHLEARLALYSPASHDHWLTRWGEDPGIVGIGFRSLVLALLNRDEEAERLGDL